MQKPFNYFKLESFKISIDFLDYGSSIGKNKNSLLLAHWLDNNFPGILKEKVTLFSLLANLKCWFMFHLDTAACQNSDDLSNDGCLATNSWKL